MMLAMQPPPGALPVALLLLVGAGCAAAGRQAVDSPALGRLVDVSAPNLGGQEVRVADRRGDVRIVDFWATWCEPCREQFPVLERLARAHREEGLSVFAVALDEDRARVADFLETTPLPFTVLWDQGGGRHAGRLGLGRLPTTLVVDRAGRVRFVHQGHQDGDAERLDREVRQLLTEPR
jgi:cytochrome c biogenesis protein CcmG/thiol:disulfide interchange protein DsbE